MANNGRKSGDAAINMIIAVVIIAVLGLGVWAVIPQIKENRENNAANTTEQTMTIANLAATEGISFEEYIDKYGLTDAGLTAEDSYQTALYAMTVENFAKANGTTVEELRSEYELPESVTNETVWSEATLEMPARIAMGGEEQFNQAKETYGLGEEFTADSRWGDVQDAIIAKLMEQQAAEETAEGETEATEAPEATAEAEKDEE